MADLPTGPLASDIPNAAQPTPGQGLTLDHNGLIPPSVLAPNPANGQALTYNASTGQSQWGTGLPAGAIVQYGGAAAPSGWLLCDGTSYLRADYANLFTAISTTYGSADGTHFNVPDLRGRVPVGYAASGGHADVSTLGNNDGVAAANRRAKHQHTAHSHGFSAAVVANNAGGFINSGATAPSPGTITSTSTADGGSGNANDSTDAPAYLVLNYIIKT